MCPPCRFAGSALTLQTRGVRLFDAESATVLHDECEYPKTCTCQHRTTSAINKGQPT